MEENLKAGKFFHRARGTIYDEHEVHDYDPFSNTSKNVLLTLNKYPYNLAEDVLHTLIWFRCCQTEEDIEQLLAHSPVEFQWMINPPAWRSCPLRQHAHVFLHIPVGQTKEQVWAQHVQALKRNNTQKF